MASKKSRFRWEDVEPRPIVGVDEVGRGCLAGPVFAAAVILDTNKKFRWYKDSKMLPEIRREFLSNHIHENHQVSIAFATVREIEELNILHASLLAMKRAVLGLGISVGHLLIDGHQKIKNFDGFQQTAVVEGDLRIKPISAASIVAKVARDRLMKEFAQVFPKYGFDSHKGYPTGFHREAIAKHGITVLHRRHFTGVREYESKRSAISLPPNYGSYVGPSL